MDDPVVRYRPPRGGRELAVRLLLFLASYALLFTAAAVQLRGEPVAALVLVGFAVAGVLAFLWVILSARRHDPDPFQAQDVEDAGPDVAGYVVTYLLPLLIPATPTFGDVIAYLMFFVVIASIYVNSDLLHVQPLLYIVGYRVHGLVTANGNSFFLVARNEPLPGQPFLAVRVTGNLLIRSASDDYHREVR